MWAVSPPERFLEECEKAATCLAMSVQHVVPQDSGAQRRSNYFA